jgi:shikimate dehydrogenase
VIVTGKTALCFTLADPVSHVRTPAAFNKLAAERGADVAMAPLELASADLADFMTVMRRMHNVNGAVVTIPHKIDAARFCDHLSLRARQCSAVNVIRRTAHGELRGDMFDGLGFVEGLARAGHRVEGRSVLLAGAGGAASAIGFALAEAGVSRLAVCNRTEQRARDLIAAIAHDYQRVEPTVASPDPSGFDIVVNATSLGLKTDDPLPIDSSKLGATQLVAEVVMQPERTPLIEAAERAGAAVHPGRAMLEAQLGIIFDVLSAPMDGEGASGG